jgi:putative membrane-bound dehydrogenase-like protein
MFAAFDDRGRLFVAESSGLDLYAELSALTRNCRISVLEDSDGDGRFEKTQVFADKLVFPMGLVWRDGKLYVADPPDLITLEDLDGDGRADKRTAILGKFGHRDNGSLHGLTFGPDGLLYMTMGEPDGYKLTRSDGTLIEGQTGALIRSKPDGSEAEVLCRGFVNLVEVVFTATGEIIGTDNWFQMPSAGIRDALVHLVEGGLYPLSLKDVGTPQPITGISLPPISVFPAVALSGLAGYRSKAFPQEMQGNLFSAQHNARKVGRHILMRDGSTFRSEDHDFVTSDDPDFHPSDVLESADGSLLVVDTGGWYVQHCPTGKIRNSHATGGIYRVRYQDARPIEDPWGIKIDWERTPEDELVNLLSDSRPVVRDRAGRTLAVRGETAVSRLGSVLRGAASQEARLNALWSLSAIPGEKSFAELRRSLLLPSPEVSSAAARALALRRDQRVAPDLCRLLVAESPQVRFAAAEALARCGDTNSLAALWKGFDGAPDAFMEHALIHAIHQIAGTSDLEAALQNPNARAQKAALQLLDQPPRSRAVLTPGRVIDRVVARDPELRQTALRILQNHPEWGKDTATLIGAWLKRPALSIEEEVGLRSLILAFQSEPAVQEALSTAVKSRANSSDHLRFVLETFSQTTLPTLPTAWIDALDRALQITNSTDRLKAIRTVALLQVPSLDGSLTRIAENPNEPSDLRIEALRGLVQHHPKFPPSAVEFLIEQLNGRAGPLTKLAASEVLRRSHLTDLQVLQALKAAGGDGLVSPSVLVQALEQSANAEASEAILDFLLESAKAGWRPTEEDLTNLSQRLSIAARRRAELLRETLQNSAELQRAKISEFSSLLAGGDAGRGRAVFFSNKAACSTCHTVGSAGGTVGPDLTKVGAIRSGWDILESILLPSSTFAQSYESYVVSTVDGRDVSGVMARQSAEAIVLRDASGGETQLRKNQIREMHRSNTSIMPEGLELGLSREEFSDLVAFLQSLK